MRILVFLFLCIGIGFLNGCKPKEKASPPVDADLPADFVAFYERFHQDSLYQMEHIHWPLQGIPSHADSTTWQEDDYYFTADQWRMHTNAAFNDTMFTRSFKVINPQMIMEFIQLREGQYGMERRFVKMDTAWNMIYYVEMNSISQQKG